MVENLSSEWALFDSRWHHYQSLVASGSGIATGQKLFPTLQESHQSSGVPTPELIIPSRCLFLFILIYYMRWLHLMLCLNLVSVRLQLTKIVKSPSFKVSFRSCSVLFLCPPCVADADIIFCPVVSSFFLFSSPNLSRRRLDVYDTSTYGVALVWI